MDNLGAEQGSAVLFAVGVPTWIASGKALAMTVAPQAAEFTD